MRGRIGGTCALLVAVAASGVANPAWAGTTERVSVGPGGAQANGESSSPSLSADGRFVAFQSRASNLVPGDTNGDFDVFVRDLTTGRTTRVSVGPGGAQSAGGGSFEPALSADGRFVAFTSQAGNLVPGDTNGDLDVFVRDLRAGTNRRVSVGPGGRQGNGGSNLAAISGDGSAAAFTSIATNLVPGDGNGWDDVFLRDLKTGRTTLISAGPGGAAGDGISREPAFAANGRFVAFWSEVGTLVPSDGNTQADVFVFDRQTGRLRLASLGPGGVQGDGGSFGGVAISAGGRFVAFESNATNLVPGDTNEKRDVFVRDLVAGQTRRASVRTGGAQGSDESSFPALSADGRFVAFYSDAANLVAGDTNAAGDVFVHDRRTGATQRVSVRPAGGQANRDSFGRPAISGDGSLVAFTSNATNLVPGDTNHVRDVFVRRR